MHTDKLVIADDILKAIRKVRQVGYQRLVEDLEAREADLIEYMLEELTTIYQKLVAIAGSSRQQRHLYRRMESLLMAIILAIQSANDRLWRDIGGTDDASAASDAFPPGENEKPNSEGAKDE